MQSPRAFLQTRSQRHPQLHTMAIALPRVATVSGSALELLQFPTALGCAKKLGWLERAPIRKALSTGRLKPYVVTIGFVVSSGVSIRAMGTMTHASQTAY